MTSFKATKIIAYSKVQEKLTPENLYWRRLETLAVLQGVGQIGAIDFSPVASNCFAATRSAKVEIYDAVACDIVSTVTKFKSSAYGGVFRGDGKLLACGTGDGRLKIFDVMSSGHSALRSYTVSQNSVHACQFACDGKKVASFDDGKEVKLWDIGATDSGAVLTTFSEHTDHVRCGATGWKSEHLLLSGSYDHSAKVWDSRKPGSVLTLSHGSPIESVLMFPNDSIAATAGGTVVKIWDIVAGGKQLAQLSQHHKTVTVIKLSSANSRLLSASLDKHVKIYDLKTFQLVHSLSYSSPILSLGISKDDDSVAVGMAVGGLLSIQRRRPEYTKSKKESEKFDGVKHFWGTSDEQVLKHKNPTELHRYDRYLRSFQHTRALSYVCSSRFFTNSRPEVVVSLLKELSRRGALHKALAGREESSLIPVIRFVARNINNQRFLNVLLGTAMLILDIYERESASFSKGTLNLFKKLSDAVDMEIAQQNEMLSLIGSIELVMNHSVNPSVNKEESIFGQPIIQRKLL